MAKNSIEVTVVDRFHLRDRLMRSPQVVHDKLNKAMLGIAIDFERTEKQFNAPFVRSSRLQSSITTERADLHYTIAPHTVYAGWVNDGSDSEFAPASHRSSGFKGHHYVEKTFEAVEPGARSELKRTIGDIISSI